MTYLKHIVILPVFLMVLLFPIVGLADMWNRKTVLTFLEPVEISGRVLPAGTYVFTLMDDSILDSNIVQVYDKNERRLIANFVAVPDERMTRTDRTEMRFAERPGRAHLVYMLLSGDVTGHEFVRHK